MDAKNWGYGDKAEKTAADDTGVDRPFQDDTCECGLPISECAELNGEDDRLADLLNGLGSVFMPMPSPDEIAAMQSEENDRRRFEIVERLTMATTTVAETLQLLAEMADDHFAFEE